MIKKQFVHRAPGVFAILLVYVASMLAPLSVFAQNADMREGQSQWQGMDAWHGHSNLFDPKISKLDTNKVVDIPVPILFGITPDNLTRNFGDPRSGGRAHEGLDIMAPKDAPIVTPTDAVVIRIGTGESAGNYVYTANPGGETFAYLHLSEIGPVHEGDEIKKGTLIGYVGNTGNASGGSTHLHFEIRDSNGFIDPFTRLTRIFPLADKIEYLKNILNIVGDKKSIIENNILTLYRKELLSAQALNIPLPVSIEDALKIKIATEVSTVVRTLKIGSTGEDVKVLQTALGLLADGNFGPKTKAAVMAFQVSKNLTADGVFGPMTRTILTGKSLTYPIGCTSLTKYSSTTGILCVPLIT